MSIEAATYIADLQSTNPPSGDPTSQGDDHLRLIKSVLQNSFAGSSRQFQIPGVLSKTANYSIVKADGESTIYSSTFGGAITYTLPSLVSGDAGWKVHFIKTSSDVNPVFIKAASGNVSSGGTSVAQARRCIPGVRVTAVWDGTNWFITRSIGLPIGVTLEFFSATLPAGYEWPNGQTLTSASTNYPEYYAANGSAGTTPDHRGYVAVTLDNLGGSAANRLAGGIINGTAVGNTGGSDTVTLTSNQIPSHAHNVYIHESGHSHTYSQTPTSFGVANQGGGGGLAVSGTSTGTTSTATTGMVIGSSPGASDNATTSVGGGGAHSNCQPSIVCAKILVVE